MIAPFHNLSDRAAFAYGFIDRGAGASAQAAQDAALGTAGIINRPSARAARSFGDPSLVAHVSIRAQSSAIEPRLIEEFAGLHMKAYCHETGLAECIARGPSPGASPEVARDALARHQVNPATVMIAILFASLVPIVIALLRRRQRR